MNVRGVIIDITDRKLAEEGLRESEQSSGISWKPPPWVYSSTNWRRTGVCLPRGESGGRPNPRDRHGRFCREDHRGGFPSSGGNRGAGSFPPSRCRGTPWYTQELIYSTRDISGLFDVSAFQTAPNEMAVMFRRCDRKRRRPRALRASEERLRLAARSGRVGIWEYEIASDHLEWDDLMYELHGVERRRPTVGIQRWRDCVHPKDLEAAEGEFRAALEVGGKPFDIQFRIIRPDNLEVRHIRGLAGVVRDTGRNPLRALGTNWDITSSKGSKRHSGTRRLVSGV